MRRLGKVHLAETIECGAIKLGGAADKGQRLARLDHVVDVFADRLTGLDHLITEFAFGGMPHEESEINMRLFADRVIPVLQRDPAFTHPSRERPPASGPSPGAKPEGIFAPA